MDQRKKYLGSAIRSVLAGVAIAVLMVAPMTANATIHEIVAAFCSGGDKGKIDSDGFLVAPGVDDMTKSNFAKPVLVSGVVDVSGGFPLKIGSSPAAKFPEGDDVLGPTGIKVSESLHPSALHCPKAADLP